MHTTANSESLSDLITPYDATIVKKLRDAGVIILGKANFSKFVSGVANAGSFAADLGLTLEEAAEYAAEEIDIRQRALAGRVQLDGQQSQSVMDAIRQTQLLAGIMGKSMKDINQDKKSFVDNNANVASLLNSIPEQHS